MSQYEYMVCGPNNPEKYLQAGYHPDFQKFLIQAVNIVISKKTVYLILNCAVPKETKVTDPAIFWTNFSLFIHHDRTKMIRTGHLKFVPISYEAGTVPEGYKSVAYSTEIKLSLLERRVGNLYDVFLEIYGVKMNKTFNKFHVNAKGEYVDV